jgi:hypothetical protein
LISVIIVFRKLRLRHSRALHGGEWKNAMRLPRPQSLIAVNRARASAITQSAGKCGEELPRDLHDLGTNA